MMIRPPRGIEPNKQLPTTGRLRLPLDLSVYLGSQQKTARVRRHRFREQVSLATFLAGHEFRIVSLPELLIEWRGH